MIEFLNKIGVKKKSAEIYLVLLRNNKSSVSQIARETSLTRTALYPYIKELKSLGLIDWNEGEKNSAIIPTPPQKSLEKIINKKLEETKIIEEKSKGLLKNLQSMYKANNEEFYIERYKGSKECKILLESVYTEKIQYGYCGEFIYEQLGSKWYSKHLRNMYKVNKILDHVIFSPKALIHISFKDLLKQTWFDEKFCKYRVCKQLDLPENMDVYILSKSVIHIFTENKEIIGVKIKSRQYRNYEKSLHQTIWKQSIPINKYKI